MVNRVLQAVADANFEPGSLWFNGSVEVLREPAIRLWRQNTPKRRSRFRSIFW